MFFKERITKTENSYFISNKTNYKIRTHDRIWNLKYFFYKKIKKKSVSGSPLADCMYHDSSGDCPTPQDKPARTILMANRQEMLSH